MSDLSLYDMTKELKDLMDSIASNEGEIDEQVENKLEKVKELITQKTDNAVYWVQSQEDLVELAKQRISDLKSFIEATEAKITRFTEYTHNCMSQMLSDRIDGKFCYITKMKPREVIVVFDESQLPVDFVKIPETKPEPMLKEIGDAIKSGINVPGASLEKSKKISIKFDFKKSKGKK